MVYFYVYFINTEWYEWIVNEGRVMSIYDRHMETMSVLDKQALQLERLQRMTDYCLNHVPFYRERLNGAGIFSGADIKTLDDIRKIPFTTKQDLIANYPNGLLAVPMDKVARVHASSGTTGKPTIGYYTQNDMELWAELSARVLCLNGLEPDDVFQISVGYGLFTGALGFHQGAERIGCTIVPASTGNTQKQLVMMRDVGVTALMATPSYATYLSDQISRSEEPRGSYRIKKVLLGAERCTAAMRRTIEENIGAFTADNYGLTECFGPGVAGECECRCGMHISDDVFYPEIVDPVTGEPLPDGRQGELVFTSLLREGMPILRYRTHDITSLHNEPCNCGRTTVRMDAPFARTDDMFVFKGVNVFPSQIECAIDRVGELSPYYHIRLQREGYRDFATLFVELKQPRELYSDAELREIEDNLQYQLREIVIVKIPSRLVDPETLQRFTGKARRVEDLRYQGEQQE